MARTIISALLPEGLLDLLELERIRWPQISERIRLSGHPTCEGEDAGEEGDAEEESEEDDADEEESDDDDEDKPVDWKSHSRKHERTAKKERKAREAAEAKLRKIEEEGQSESDKALTKAREEAKAEAAKESAAERRDDRLEVKVTRLASKGLKVKDGDEEHTLRFADPDDALLHIQRAIKNGDVDEDEIFDDEGRVNTEALTDALTDLLADKPHLRATETGSGRFAGDAGGGKGKGRGKAAEDLSADEHLAAIRRHKP